MTVRVFLSYRREDSKHAAGRLGERLDEHFSLFMDVDRIRPGADFTAVVRDAVLQTDVLVAVIGSQWLSLRAEDGSRRIDQVGDWVVEEVGAALERGTPVIPVLVDGAQMPARAELPVRLADLASRQAMRVAHESFSADSARLIETIEGMVTSARPESVNLWEDPDYPQARGAFLQGLWPEAISGFERVLRRHPRQPRVSEQLEEARRSQRLLNLRAAADDAMEAERWDEAVETLAAMKALQPADSNVAGQLEQARLKVRVAELRNDIRAFAATESWPAVLAADAELVRLDPQAADPDGLTSKARAEHLKADLSGSYARGVRQLEANDWKGAEATLTSLLDRHPGYRDADALLHLARRNGQRSPESPPSNTLPAPVSAVHRPPNQLPPPSRTLSRKALVVCVVLAMTLVSFAIFYGVGGFDQTPSANSSASQAPRRDFSAQPPKPVSALTAELMLSPEQAKTLDQNRSWTVAKTETGPTEDTRPACFASDPPEGQPEALQRLNRTLDSSGKRAPRALHQAAAYASPKEATQAYAVVARTLGGCPIAGMYIESGRVVGGLGDQATGVVVNVIADDTTNAHSMVVSRTGRFLNLLDVVQQRSALSINKVAEALAAAIGAQCGAAGGACADTPSVKDGPPPIGGDEPGFLATGDLPPAKARVSTWDTTPSEPPEDDFVGSGCEAVTWTSVNARSKRSRVYIYANSGDSYLGVNEIVLTMNDDKAATSLVTKVKKNIAGCEERRLTATVTKPQKVVGLGAKDSEVVGWTALVTQRSTQGPSRYRVGIVAAGSKVAYTFLNPKNDYDLTEAQWDTVSVRAGQRATEVN